MKTETIREMRQNDLRSLILEQLCDLLDIAECHDELTQVNVEYHTAKDGSPRTYEIYFNLPEKEITVKQPTNDYEEKRENRPDGSSIPFPLPSGGSGWATDFDPDRDAIG
jgi:hypothetical protein